MATDRVKRQIDRLLDEAEQAVGRRDWTTVRDLANDVLAFDPDNEDGQAFMAAAQRSLDAPVEPSPPPQPPIDPPSVLTPASEHPTSPLP